MITDKDKLNLIVKIIRDVAEYPPDGDGAYMAVLSCIDIIAQFEEDGDVQ